MKKFLGITLIVGFVIMLLVLIALGQRNIFQVSEGEKYYCNVKVLTLSTNIEVSKDSIVTRKISANILRFLTDPLTMYDEYGNKIGYAGDSYRLIAQDSHGIYVNDEFMCDMDGKVNFFGETYKLYDADNVQIGEMEFNQFDTKGTLHNMDGKLLATYSSNILRQDYIVTISKECQIDSDTILLLFASYVSDKNSDNSN